MERPGLSVCSELSDVILVSNMSFLGLKEVGWLDCKSIELARPSTDLMILAETFFCLQNKHKAAQVSQTPIQPCTSREVRNHPGRLATADRASVKGSYFTSLV